MPTLVPYIALFSVASFLTGALLNWLVNDRRNRRERAKLAKEIKKRYAAYLKIEARIANAITRFDQHEEELSVRLAEQREKIRDLNRALDWELPDDEATTVAGLVIHEAQTIPEEKQAFTFYGKRFVVMHREKNRLTQLRIRNL